MACARSTTRTVPAPRRTYPQGTVTTPQSPSTGVTKRRRDATTQELCYAVKQANAANQKPDEAVEREMH